MFFIINGLPEWEKKKHDFMQDIYKCAWKRYSDLFFWLKMFWVMLQFKSGIKIGK